MVEIVELTLHRPFLNSRISHFQNETKCKTVLANMNFNCLRLKNHLYINSFSLSLALKRRLAATRKWQMID